MIEIAQTEEDIEAVFEMLLLMRNETRFKKYAYEKERTMNTLRGLVRNHVIFMAKKKGDLIGALALSVGKHPLLEYSICSDLFLYVLPNCRNGSYALRLIKAGDVWRKNLGVDEYLLGVTTQFQPEKTSKLYELAGLPLLGFVHCKE